MGTLRFAGVTFQVFTHDHLPRHVHGRYAGIEVIVELKDGYARIADRRDPVDPPNGKRSDVAYIVRAANEQLEQLHKLWEMTHDRA